MTPINHRLCARCQRKTTRDPLWRCRRCQRQVCGHLAKLKDVGHVATCEACLRMQRLLK